MDNITYHKATVEDTSILVEQRIQFTQELSGKQNAEIVSDLRNQMTNYFSNATADNTCISFIAKCDGAVAGIGSMHVRNTPGNFKNPTGKWGYIMNMYTLPDYRRKGICKALLNLLVEEGQKYGITAFELHATREGEYVYSQNGFKIHDEPTYRKFIVR